MSSTTSSISSPRSQRMLMWISGAVLVAGAAVFLAVYFGRGSAQDVNSGPAPKISQADPTRVNPITGNIDAQKVPASADARNVARTFLETAVARKNLDVAWGITGPWLKGESRAEWLTGQNPVIPYPATNFKTAPFKVLSSTKGDLLLEVGPLTPPAKELGHGKALRPLTFKLEVVRIHGKWLVNYWEPEYALKHLAGQGAGIGGD